MPLDFPSNPTNGQVYDNFYYDSSISAWRNNGSKNGLSARLAAEETLNAGPNKSGLVPVIPSSVAVESGSASIDSTTGLITFTGVSAVKPRGSFTSQYTNYLVVYNVNSATAATGIAVQFAVNGTTDTAATYRRSYREQLDGNAPVNSGASSSTYIRISRTETTGTAGEIMFYSPYNSNSRTRVVGEAYDGAYWSQGAGIWSANKLHDGFRMSLEAGATTYFTGTMQIYGYR